MKAGVSAPCPQTSAKQSEAVVLTRRRLTEAGAEPGDNMPPAVTAAARLCVSRPIKRTFPPESRWGMRILFTL